MSSSNFAAIARLVVLARKDPRTTSPFSNLLDLHFVLTAGFLKKGEYNERKFHRYMLNKFQVPYVN